jgi:hypothetical protein
MRVDPAAQARLPWRRRWRRRWVRLRTHPALIPGALVGVYLLVMLGLSRVADGWIVALALVPLLFAIVLGLGCLAAYRRDFYA